MLTHYLDDENERPIPYTNNRYWISLKGIVTERNRGIEIKPDSTNKVEISIFGHIQSIKLDWLMLATFKPMYRAEDFILNWTVLHIDENEDNVHPINLIWCPPLGGQDCPEKEGFKIIPHFSIFAINENGEVYNRFSDCFIATRKISYLKENDYINFRVKYSDYTPVSNDYIFGIHRALGLAYLPYSNRVNNLTVNHRDGIKFNNKLLNLEWTTQNKNIIHAMDSGLNNCRQPVKLMDYFSGEETHYKSMLDLAKYLNVQVGHINQLCKKPGQRPFRFQYLVKLEDDLTPWPMFDKEELIKQKQIDDDRKKELECCAVNIYTNVVYYADNPAMLGKMLNLHHSVVYNALDMSGVWPAYNHVFSYLNNPKYIRKFTDEEKIAFKDKFGIKFPMKVTDKNNKVTIFAFPRECMEFLGMSDKETRYLSDRIYRSGGKYRIGDYVVEYVKI